MSVHHQGGDRKQEGGAKEIRRTKKKVINRQPARKISATQSRDSARIMLIKCSTCSLWWLLFFMPALNQPHEAATTMRMP
jgi:hypothetical protein